MGEMRRFQKTRMAAAVGAALSLTTGTAYAAEGAGRVLSTSGSVYAVTEDGSTRALKQGRQVYSGDTIETREGRIQIRFHDGGLVSLKPGTEFEIEEYVTDADGEGGNAAMRLLKGAMRTITGAIDGKGDDDYSVDTPVATIGIRGTQYALTLCDANRCGDDVDNGLYGQVVSNNITVRNGAGQSNFSSGSWFQVPDSNTPPKRILQPSGVVFRGDAGAEEPGDELAGEGRGDAVVNRILEDDNGEVELFELFSRSRETGNSFASSLIPNGAVGISVIGNNGSSYSFPTCISDASCTASVDDAGNLRLFESASGVRVDATSNVQLVESGQIDKLDARWGRWKGDIVIDNGNEFRTVTGNMPWAYSTNLTTPTELSNRFSSGTGTIFFDLAGTGGPSPVGSINGTDWSVSNLSVAADYDGAGTATINTFNVRLDLSGPDSVILENENDTATIDPANGDQGFTVALERSSTGDEGELSAVFAGDNADGLVVDFSATDISEGEVIKGVKILDIAN